MANEVKEIFEKSISIEGKYENEIEKLKWDYADVLFSFRGVYTIGLSIYYKESFRWSGNIIKPIIHGETNTRQHAYSRKFLKANYKKYTRLNELDELKKFIMVYRTIGNLIPIWPGGNVHRGQSQCYDIPSIYFNKDNIKKYSKDFFKKFYDKEDEYFNDVLNGRYRSLKVDDFQQFTEEDYKEFLKYITDIIEKRKKLIEGKL